MMNFLKEIPNLWCFNISLVSVHYWLHKKNLRHILCTLEHAYICFYIIATYTGDAITMSSMDNLESVGANHSISAGNLDSIITNDCLDDEVNASIP